MGNEPGDDQGGAGWTSARAASKAGRDQGKGTAPRWSWGISGAVCAMKRASIYNIGETEGKATRAIRTKNEEIKEK